jgi:hypothetical protein
MLQQQIATGGNSPLMPVGGIVQQNSWIAIVGET